MVTIFFSFCVALLVHVVHSLLFSIIPTTLFVRRIQSNGHWRTSYVIPSSVSRNDNVIYLFIKFCLMWMYIWWKSALKSIMHWYFVNRCGDNLGFWLITIHNSISNITQNILFPMTWVGSFVLHSKANLASSHKYGSVMGKCESSSIL